MRSQDYLRQAANSLRQAAVARKQEYDELTRELDQKDQAYKQKVNELRREQGQDLAEAAQEDSNVETARKTRDAQLLQVEESQTQQQYNYERQQISQKLSEMQTSINNFTQQAKDLDAQSRT